VLVAAPAHASPGPAVIAFDRTRDGAGRVATVRTSGGHVTTLTPAPGNESPVWSPDGRSLVFVSGAGFSDSDLYVTVLASGRTRRLTRLPGLNAYPSWSPDSRRIAWTSGPGGRLGIWVASRTGAGPRRLTHGGHDAYPAWSPDGTRIAYLDLADGALWLVRADGSGARRLPVPSRLGGAAAPSWAPDGHALAVPAASGAIYVVPTGGGRVRALTRGHGATLAWRPVWSPTGASIAFLDLDHHGALDVVAANGRGLRTLVPRSDGLSAPSWSPDGRALAFADAAQHIEIVAADGRDRHAITQGRTADANPAWRP
jgi:Tol biopolymer transport system component